MYKVTGTDRSGKRFKIESSNYFYVSCINVYKGSLWQNCQGKWKVIKRYY